MRHVIRATAAAALIALFVAMKPLPARADAAEDDASEEDGPTDAVFGASIVKLTPEAREVALKTVDRVAHLRTRVGTCAGVLVEPDLLLTAWHCVNKIRDVEITWKDGKNERVGHVVAKDEGHDLAVLRLDRPVQFAPLSVAPLGKPLASGDPLIAIGHPLGADFKVTGGIAIKPDRSYFLFDAEVKPGNSGGPVLNMKGEIVGIAIVLNQLVGEREISDAVGVEPIEAILEKAKPRRAVSWRGATNTVDFQLGYARDRFLDEISTPNYASFYYGLNVDWKDRIRTGFHHMIMRPERVYGWELGYVFRETLFGPALLLGRNYYFGQDDAFVANKLGVAFTFIGIEFQVFRILRGDEQYLAYAIVL